MANNHYKVIRAHELLPHEKRCVEGDFSHLSEQDLDQLAPTALDGQKFKQELEQGEYLLLSDSPVKPRYPGKLKPPLGGNCFSGTPTPSIDETYTPEPTLPDPPKDKPLLYQYCIEINCSQETFQHYRNGSFILTKTAAEVTRSVSFNVPLNNGYHRCHFFCAQSELKKLRATMDRTTIHPRANYTVTEPTTAEDIPTNVQDYQHTGCQRLCPY